MQWRFSFQSPIFNILCTSWISMGVSFCLFWEEFSSLTLSGQSIGWDFSPSCMSIIQKFVLFVWCFVVWLVLVFHFLLTFCVTCLYGLDPLFYLQDLEYFFLTHSFLRLSFEIPGTAAGFSIPPSPQVEPWTVSVLSTRLLSVFSWVGLRHLFSRQMLFLLDFFVCSLNSLNSLT